MNISPAPDPDEEPVSVVGFPRLADTALYGLPGKIIAAISPYTEAHPAPMLVQFLAVFGCTIGAGAHVRADNRKHAARLNPLIVGKTSDGAKGTSYGAVSAVFATARQYAGSAGNSVWSTEPLRQVSGLSTGEGLIELVRDANSDDPNVKDFDEGITDKRLLVVEEEFVGVLEVSKREGNSLPRVMREAWDGLTLRTLTRNRSLRATDPHITIIGHVTPGELRLKLDRSAMLGGTMNRFLPVASRRTRLLPDGGNIPEELLGEYGPVVADAIELASGDRRVERTPAAQRLWRARYAHLRRSRPDGPVATILARSAPQVLRLALAYALADRSDVIDEPHLQAALAIWDYVEQTAEWMFGAHIDSQELDDLLNFIVTGGDDGRSKRDIIHGHFKGNRAAAEIDALLAELIKDGRVRQETEQRSGPGRRAVRYYP